MEVSNKCYISTGENLISLGRLGNDSCRWSNFIELGNEKKGVKEAIKWR